MSLRHYTCHRCGALVFTEMEGGTRCANCFIREQTELFQTHEQEQADRIIDSGDLLTGLVEPTIPDF
jgi:uncharacterized Zn finger protein (UPF0148 family)